MKATELVKKYSGCDNHGKPRVDYVNRIAAMTDEDLAKECESKIWLSAYAGNNSRSDYHWHVDALYDECETRKKPEIYTMAYNVIKRQLT